MSSNLAENLIIDVPVVAGAAVAAWFGGKAIFKRIVQGIEETKREKKFLDFCEASERDARAALGRFQKLKTPPPPQ